MKKILLAVFVTIPAIVFAGDNACDRTTITIRTPLGILSQFYCSLNGHPYTEWRINEKTPLFRSPVSGFNSANFSQSHGNNATIVIFSGTPYGQPQPAICLDKIYLGDFSGGKPRIFDFGITNSCNTFHWSSWGKGNTGVIAMTKNVKIRYKNGKFTFPDWEDYVSNLLSATGSNKAVDYKPFVHELPFPAAPLK